MNMPLVMLGSSYARKSFGAETDPGFVGPPSSLMNTTATPGTNEWWNIANTIISTGGKVASDWFKSQQKVAVTPAQQQAVAAGAAQAGVSLNTYLPYIIGGGALLVVVVLLAKRKRR